jgi:hypothetical protein
MADLVTGDAVVLELRLAKLASRAVARLLDLLVQLVAVIFGAIALPMLIAGLDEALQAAVILVSVVTLLVGYPVAMETLTRGRTLGKMALGAAGRARRRRPHPVAPRAQAGAGRRRRDLAAQRRAGRLQLAALDEGQASR